MLLEKAESILISIESKLEKRRMKKYLKYRRWDTEFIDAEPLIMVRLGKSS